MDPRSNKPTHFLSFFSRSNYRDNTAVRQIFFNDKLFGGLVASNSLRNSGGFDQRVKEMLSTKCPSDDVALASLVYRFLGLVRVVMVRREESE